MNKKTQGNLAEIAAMYYYRNLGYSVSKPVFEDSHVDLHIQKDGLVKRVQVKSSSFKAPSGNYEVSLKTSGGNQSWSGICKYLDKSFIDLILIQTTDNCIYEYTSEILHGRTSVTVHKGLEQYKGKLGIY